VDANFGTFPEIKNNELKTWLDNTIMEGNRQLPIHARTGMWLHKGLSKKVKTYQILLKSLPGRSGSSSRWQLWPNFIISVLVICFLYVLQQ